ncbi:glutaredoxin [Pisolithus croceorrhizus]|nr:glutaredoxin [Pisolithus croceorrhizus]KAI6142322.1 glutaredoxin [Pisolithus thermaeus]
MSRADDPSTSPATTNFHEIKSTEQFQNLLSADLSRVSLINFWAPWAEPCKQMNEVVTELAKRYPRVLVLQVEAEEQEEISASFEVESVPMVLLLRGHTLLEKIVGADATRLTSAIAKHVSGAPSLSPPSPPPGREESEAQLEERIRQIMKKSKVVLFMKGSPDKPRCGFSRKAVGLLTEQEVTFTHFDILEDEAVRQGKFSYSSFCLLSAMGSDDLMTAMNIGLKKINDWPTYPQFIVDGTFVGGLDVVTEMVESGEFQDVFGSIA